jgi:uncharacterized delta-60 repeat protein
MKKASLVATLIAFLVFLFPSPASASNVDGSLDLSFSQNTLTSVGDTVVDVAIQQDGQILAASSDTIYRINPDGTASSSVITTQDFDGINSIAVDALNRIVVVGGFSRSDYGGTSDKITRLLPDGTIDSSFNAGDGLDSNAQNVVILPDGKILVAGNFGSYDNQSVPPLIRLNSDGSLDSSWLFGSQQRTIYNALEITLLPDGRILTSGNALVGGNQLSLEARVFMLSSNGVLDPSFNEVTCLGAISGTTSVPSIQQTPTGSFLLAGDFDSCVGHNSQGVIQVTASGSYDPSFQSGVGLTGSQSGKHALDAYVQKDGKILVIGIFDGYNNQVVTNGIIRLLPNGLVDSSFELSGGFLGGNNPDQGRSIALQPTGGIVIGGIITSFNSQSVGTLIRLFNAPDLAAVPASASSLANTGYSTGLFAGVITSGVSLILFGFFAVKIGKQGKKSSI